MKRHAFGRGELVEFRTLACRVSQLMHAHVTHQCTRPSPTSSGFPTRFHPEGTQCTGQAHRDTSEVGGRRGKSSDLARARLEAKRLLEEGLFHAAAEEYWRGIRSGATDVAVLLSNRAQALGTWGGIGGSSTG